MKKGRSSEKLIVGVLKQHEAGVKPSGLCREHWISAATFCGWKQKFGGVVDGIDIFRLRFRDKDPVYRLCQTRSFLALVRSSIPDRTLPVATNETFQTPNLPKRKRSGICNEGSLAALSYVPLLINVQLSTLTVLVVGR